MSCKFLSRGNRAPMLGGHLSPPPKGIGNLGDETCRLCQHATCSYEGPTPRIFATPVPRHTCETRTYTPVFRPPNRPKRNDKGEHHVCAHTRHECWIGNYPPKQGIVSERCAHPEQANDRSPECTKRVNRQAMHPKQSQQPSRPNRTRHAKTKSHIHNSSALGAATVKDLDNHSG